MRFSHLHNHTQFSLLDGASSVKKLYQKAIADNMPAMAITDHGNMFGVFEFVAEAHKHIDSQGKLKVKPIVGCEFYVVDDITQKNPKTKKYHQVLLAKNIQGYKNLLHLSHISYVDGFYGKACIDKALITKYSEGLIATTCCLGAYVPQAILTKGEGYAEEEFKWWLNLFHDDYYIELQRHHLKEQDRVNYFLLQLSKKYHVPVVATNDCHYVEKEDALAQDILLCINTGAFLSDPKKESALADEEGTGLAVGETTNSMARKNRRPRFAFPNNEFYVKNTQEMIQLFADIPEAVDNTNSIIDKIEILNLKRDILLPKFPIPTPFTNVDDYLIHWVNEGLRKKYSIITPEIEERVRFELDIIRKMDFVGYFLIVADFIKAAREMNVYVGPGRGSAAGSVVAYCMDIITIDPIKYNLLFERFLNPDRKSMPDIDTDFDDVGRGKVIDYVIRKYGTNHVAQIITYGTMAARASMKDVGRAMEIPLQECNMLTNLVPQKIGVKLDTLLHSSIQNLKDDLNADQIEQVNILRKYYQENASYHQMLDNAVKLEGTIRNVGLHAAGIIIAPEPLDTLIPVCKLKDSELLVTQIEGAVIEEAGVIKIDFLGLSNLNIIKDCLIMINERKGILIDIQNIPLDDKKTFELYQQGSTNGIFQFESVGMQKYLRELRPDKLEDLIAMNALYRPGPMQYIPNFIHRKHGEEMITYDLPEMEEYLSETYGITVYQEQVMLLSQKLADFTKGEADVLRKAMGKKQKDTLAKMKQQFIQQAIAKGHPANVLEKIWTDWEAFAQYAFNKSHSTCYAFLSYQTAYLKANYPHEYMASLLNNAKDVDKISFIIDECKRMKIDVLPPDINESQLLFSVTSKDTIRFGLSAIKNLGFDMGTIILEDRNKHGVFKDIFDFAKRVISGKLNLGKLDSLIKAGVFDCFNISRAQYIEKSNTDSKNFLEKLIDYAKAIRQNDHQGVSLFDGVMDVTELITAPQVPTNIKEWGLIEKLNYEREMTGIYLSQHPLDIFNFEITYYNFTSLNQFQDIETNYDLKKQFAGKRILIGGFITYCIEKTSAKGTLYAEFRIEDKTGKYLMRTFGDQYHKILKPYLFLHSYIYIEGAFQENPYRLGNFEFKPIVAGELALFRDQYTKKIELFLSADKIEHDFLNQLQYQIKNRGKTLLTIHINAPNNPTQEIILSNQNHRIALTNDFCKYLENSHCMFKLVTE